MIFLMMWHSKTWSMDSSISFLIYWPLRHTRCLPKRQFLEKFKEEHVMNPFMAALSLEKIRLFINDGGHGCLLSAWKTSHHNLLMIDVFRLWLLQLKEKRTPLQLPPHRASLLMCCAAPSNSCSSSSMGNTSAIKSSYPLAWVDLFYGTVFTLEAAAEAAAFLCASNRSNLDVPMPFEAL